MHFFGNFTLVPFIKLLRQEIYISFMTPSRTLKKWTITGYFTIISRISRALLVYNDHLTHNANTIVKEILSYRIEMSKVQKLSFSPRLWPIYLYCAAFIIIISRGINYVQVWWRRRRTTQSVRYLYHLSTTVQRRVGRLSNKNNVFSAFEKYQISSSSFTSALPLP